jgi:protein-disulfide isomerase
MCSIIAHPLAFGLVLLVGLARADAAPCDRVPAEKRGLLARLLRSTHPYDCCDETLERCLKQKSVCKLAKRLRDDLCRRVARGDDEKKIKLALERRARSMTPTPRRSRHDLSGVAVAGDPKGKVVVVVYACARCPYCSKVVPELHRLASSSGLKGKLAVYFRPFPISGHRGSLEGGLAFIAAQRLGRFWPYLLLLYAEYDRFSVAKLGDWAAAVGMDRAAFAKAMAAPETRKLLVEAKKEGLRNEVDATPTLFINGRQYEGDLDRDSLLDVLDEEADRTAQRTHCEAGSGP